MVLLPEPDHAGGTKKEKQKNNGSQYYGDSRSNVSGKIIHKWKKERPVEAALIIKGITNNYSALSHHQEQGDWTLPRCLCCSWFRESIGCNGGTNSFPVWEKYPESYWLR